MLWHNCTKYQNHDAIRLSKFTRACKTTSSSVADKYHHHYNQKDLYLECQCHFQKYVTLRHVNTVFYSQIFLKLQLQF